LSSSSSCPLSWLPFHASLALNLALVYYICLSLSPDRALQHDDHGIRCSSLSNHHQQQQEQQLLHRSPRSTAASPNVFCNNTRLTTSFSRDPWEEPVVLQTDDDSPCVSCAPAPVLEGSPYVSFSALDHTRECSSNGHFVVLDQQQQKKAVGRRRIGACHCHPCFTGPRCAELATNCILNLSMWGTRADHYYFYYYCLSWRTYAIASLTVCRCECTSWVVDWWDSPWVGSSVGRRCCCCVVLCAVGIRRSSSLTGSLLDRKPPLSSRRGKEWATSRINTTRSCSWTIIWSSQSANCTLWWETLWHKTATFYWAWVPLNSSKLPSTPSLQIFPRTRRPLRLIPSRSCLPSHSIRYCLIIDLMHE
jgi:hypothetical protein